MTSAQLLVTDHDFRDKDFRKQLSETVKSLLALKVVPILNENDAVSTRRAPYEVYFSFFISWIFDCFSFDCTVLFMLTLCRILLVFFGIMIVCRLFWL